MTGSVDDLLAKQAITEVLYRYCRALDRMDRELAASCWHDGATVDYGDRYRGTAIGFLEWVWPVHRDGFRSHSHQVTNVLVEVRGDGAASEAYVTVALRTGAEPDRLVDVVARGRYLDRWSRRAGGWAIDHRRYVGDLEATYAVRGTAGTADEADARRDRSDPSYELFEARAPDRDR